MKHSIWAYPKGAWGESFTSDRDALTFYAIEGSALMMLGMAAIIVPMFASFVTELFVGWLLLFSGSIRIMALVRARHAPGFWWAAMTAALAVGLGVLLLIRPISGMFTLTIVLMIMFAADGVASIFTALDYRKHVSNWGLILVSGVVNLALASMIYLSWPLSGAIAVGLFVGISLLFCGLSLTFGALARVRMIDAKQADAKDAPNASA